MNEPSVNELPVNERVTQGRRIRRLGLTGSIGAGKSTVAAILRELGLTVTDADALAKAASEAPKALAAIATRWPTVVREGQLNRAALASQVFGDPKELAALEAILHPQVRAATEAAVQAAQARGEAWIVHDIPLLFEKGLDEEMDAVWVVDASPSLRHERLYQRSGLTPQQVSKREAAQLPSQYKRERADTVLDNSGDLAALRAAVQRAAAELLG